MAEAAPDMLLAVGDLQDYEPWPVPTTFVRGNHEDWGILEGLAKHTLSVPNLTYLTDGQRLSIGGASIAGVGGNWSPGGKQAPKYIRHEYLAKFASERADIILSHETPIRFSGGRHDYMTLEPMREVALQVRPKLWFSGHHHHYEEEQIDARTTFVSLGKWPDEWVMMDIDRGQIEWSRFVPSDPAYNTNKQLWRLDEEVQKTELLALERRHKRR